MEKLNLLIDAKNFCFRAGVVEDLTNRKGVPIYLLYVGVKMLRKLVYDYKPKRIIFLWDGGRSEWRKKLYPEYITVRKDSVVSCTCLSTENTLT